MKNHPIVRVFCVLMLLFSSYAQNKKVVLHKNRRITTILTFALLVLITFSACSKPKDNLEYLVKVLNNLEEIKSATYFSVGEAFAPGDTTPYAHMDQFVKEYNNPLDTPIGASFVNLLYEDPTRMSFCYDGKMKAEVYEESKSILVDSFTVRKLPFRPLSPPFFNYTQSIIRYALETNDSISIEIEENKESVYFCVTIFEDQQVEFFGKAHHIETPPFYIEPTSKYGIWIDKSTDLPFKVRREMSHQTSTELVSDIKLNSLKIEDFKALDYFPKDYEIRQYGQKREKSPPNELIGKQATDWVLQDASASNVGLEDMKSKVIMIQFTSVTCGPCRVSIPFLNQLTSAYKKEDFDFVAIECTANSLNALKTYQDRNSINYRFLFSTEDVLKDYSISSYPVFFILDENRIIKEVITGYGEGTTDNQIKSVINELIK